MTSKSMKWGAHLVERSTYRKAQTRRSDELHDHVRPGIIVSERTVLTLEPERTL